MSPVRFILLLGLGAWMAAATAIAQPARRSDAPALAYVYPAGGTAGTTFEVTVGGQRLLNTSGAVLSLPGAIVEVVGVHRQLSAKEAGFLENNISVLQKARTTAKGRLPGWTPDDQQLLESLRAERENRPNRQIPATLAEKVTLRVTLPKDAPPAPVELRLATSAGLSNPLVFQVGDLPEFIEPLSERGRAEIPGRDTTSTLEVNLPALINGRIMPADTDRYRFHARRGQRLVFAVSARTLIPYLADAVPGWFQATLSLRDAAGNEVAYVDDFRQNPDPALVYPVDRDGDYVLEITDALHRGREDFVYRIAAGEIPCVTGVFPAGGDADQSVAVRLHGWNLPATAGIAVPAGPAGPVRLPLPRGLVAASSLDFQRDHGAETVEREPNDALSAAQPVSTPVVINGVISAPEDIDRFRLTASQGDEIVVEVEARRLGSPLDSVVTIAASDGRVLASNDDHNDPAAGLVTHQADSLLRFTVPADGDYVVGLRDTASQGGADHVYRLRIGPPRPGVTVQFEPSAILVRPGGQQTRVTAHVIRRDGYSGPVVISLGDASAGLRLAKPVTIPADKDEVEVALAASSNLADGVHPFALNATITVDDHETTVAATPADDRMQAFLPRHLVPAQQGLALVARPSGWRKPPRPSVESPLKIAPGGEARFTLPIPALKGVQRVAVMLRDEPEGLSLTSAPTAPDNDLEVVLHCDAAKLKDGMQGSFALAVLAEDIQRPVPGGRLLSRLPPMIFEIETATPPESPKSGQD